MCWVKLDSLLHREVQCSPQSVWSPGGCSLFFWRFLGSSCWSTAALGRDRGLLLRTGVQLVVFCTAIEIQIVFEMLLALVTGQLAIAGQLEREVHCQDRWWWTLFYFLFSFYFTFLFFFLFLEQLGLGFISHTVTSVTKWWCSHKTDHGTWEKEVEGSGTKWCHIAWTTHAGLM